MVARRERRGWKTAALSVALGAILTIPGAADAQSVATRRQAQAASGSSPASSAVSNEAQSTDAQSQSPALAPPSVTPGRATDPFETSSTPETPTAAPEAAPEPWFLMKSLKGTWVGNGLERINTSIYGWLQQGFAGNPASPSDRVNFGANLDWRSNDYRLNQFYLIMERPLDRGDEWNVGYRLDFLVGTDAPWFVANGLFSGFTGYDLSSGIGVDGPKSFRQVNAVGIDLPQFFAEVHIPRVLTPGGIDIKLGKFYSLMGREVYPAADTDFYSRTWENIVATPFTNTGGLLTVHATPTFDIVAGVVIGWDVFKDNNSMASFTGSFIWNSADKRYNWNTSWITGPEQPDNDRNYRTLVTSYLTMKLDKAGDWVLAAGGHFAHEANAAVNPATGQQQDAQWYGTTVNLFYQLFPQLRLGGRFEWFRDAEGTRTAILGRPGFRANFFDATLGVTYTPWRAVIIRPELRVDWSPDARAYDDQTKKVQFVPAIDVILRF